jgi:acyl-CoA thioester hydrolase
MKSEQTSGPEFRFSTPIEVRFRDLDALNHVNNAVYFSYMEHARFAYLKHLGLFESDASNTGMILAEASCTFKAPITLGQNVVARVRATDLKNSSFAFEYSLEDAESGQVMATGRTAQVCFDYAANKSIPIPARWRERIDRFERGETTNNE